MSYRGKVCNGKVEFDPGPIPPEGLIVRIEAESTEHSAGNAAKSLGDALLEIAGTVDDLPPDFAENHDHYIHGQPKR